MLGRLSVLLLAAGAVFVACSTVDPDNLPLMRMVSHEQADRLVPVWLLARRVVSHPRCQNGVLGVADGTLRRKLDWTLYVGAQDDSVLVCEKYGLVAFTVPGTAVVVLCPAFWRQTTLEQVGTLVHETVHVVGAKHDDGGRKFDLVIVQECLIPYFGAHLETGTGSSPTVRPVSP
jgi:hypothetical protein